ncbi:MAG: hypothetical protein IPJ58_16585 [Ardenticatenia bacterium]|nr:hypothetical protein [Ardenticatenia bacterium]
MKSRSSCIILPLTIGHHTAATAVRYHKGKVKAMMKAALCLTMLVVGLSVGCAGETPTPTPEPTATAAPEPTATATPEGLTVVAYRDDALVQLQKMVNAGTSASQAVRDGKWITDGPARDAVVADLKTVLTVESLFKNTTPPDGARDVHMRMLVMTTNYANSMRSLAEATDAIAAGDAAGAKKKVDEHAALLTAASATLDEDIAALRACPLTPATPHPLTPYSLA